MENASEPLSGSPRRFIDGPALYFLIGVAAAVVGLLPWVITGMRLPAQNLWALNVLPTEMPSAFLPFSQYALGLIGAIMVVGWALAGTFLRYRPARSRRAPRPGRPARSALLPTAAGVALVQIVALVQTAITVSSGLRGGTESNLYLALLVVVSVVSILLGFAVFVVLARAPIAGGTVAVSFAAVALGPWLEGAIVPLGSFATDTDIALLRVVRWIPAIFVGFAVAWCGFTTIARAAGSVASFLLLWIAPTLLTAISAAAGTRVYARLPAEMLGYGVDVFRSVLGSTAAVTPLLLAAIVMAIVMSLRWMSRRRVPTPA